MEAGADIHAKDIDGNTPFAIAVSSYADKSIPVLIAFGSEINTPNKYGETPLIMASKYGHFQICKDLIENYNPDPFICCNMGHDAIQTAIYNNQTNLAGFYLDRFKNKLLEPNYFIKTLNICLNNLKGAHCIEMVLKILGCISKNNKFKQCITFTSEMLAKLILLKNF